MNDDERRPAGQLQRLIAAEVRRDAEAAAALLEERQQAIRRLESEVRTAEARPPVAPVVPAAAGPAAPADGNMGDPETLEQRLEQDPTPALLGACLERLWHVRGALEQCVMLLVLHADLVPLMAAEQQQLADRIWGSVALEESLERIVPPRSSGAAHLPELGRIMYCASSTPVFETSGDSVRTRGIASGLKGAGADIVVMGRSGYPWDVDGIEDPPAGRRRTVETLDGVDYVHRPEGDARAQRADHYVQIAADALVREARVQRPSIIHAASGLLPGLAALVAARRLGLPFVAEVRELGRAPEPSLRPEWAGSERCAWQERMETFIVSQADAVVAASEEIADELLRRGTPAERVRVLPQGVDAQRLLPLPRDAAFAAAHGLEASAPVIGFAGSFAEQEGLLTLLQAANILRGREIAFQLALAGAGGVLPQIARYRKRAALGRTVRYVGRQPFEEIPRFLSCLDIVVCPRGPASAPELVAPLKALEAWAASKPAVLSDIPAHRGLMGQGQERGMLFEPGDAKSLANALQELIEDPELRTAKGRVGRLWAVEKRQWSELVGIARLAHADAVSVHRAQAAQARAVSALRVGVIAGERTVEMLQRSTHAVVLKADAGRAQLKGSALDLVLIVSEEASRVPGGPAADASSEAEEEASIESLARLLQDCRSLSVPTVLWSHGDPRTDAALRRLAAMADHVLTTDADLIGEHLRAAHELGDGASATAASLPLVADPTVHSPLTGRGPMEGSAAFTGERSVPGQSERSRLVEQLLKAATEAADGHLVLYDRHLSDPEVLRRWPRDLAEEVRAARPDGGLPDDRRLHLAHLVASPDHASPTRFPPRVVESAASGEAVLTTSCRGIPETFGDGIPSSSDPLHWRALVRAWVTDPAEHQREAWHQMRTILRSHTIQTALILMARTAGIAVEGLRLPTWACELTAQNADQVLRQSVPPRAVRLGSDAQQLRAAAQARGLRVLSQHEALPGDLQWWAQIPAAASGTWAEDMLSATRWGAWTSIGSHHGVRGDDTRSVARAGRTLHGHDGSMTRILHGALSEPTDPADAAVTLMLSLPQPAEPAQPVPEGAPAEARPSVRTAGPVLIAGHDLKFARSWIEHLEASGVEVLLDEWQGHSTHDEQRSLELLARARTIFCEWGLGNAVWYSRSVRADQRLVVRVHAQELSQPHLRRIRHESVDEFLFVGELMRDAAVRSHGIPRHKTRVIPNIVRAGELQLPKTEAAEFTVGLVGMVPQVKRLDRAVTVIEDLAAQDPRWTLRVRGRRPEDYPWMRQRKAQMAWYRECFRRIEELHAAVGREVVVFDPHGDDMPTWYQGIGYALSVSDLESFHLTLPDGAASGAAPVSLAWPGSDRIYPREWLVSSLGALSDRVAALQRDPTAKKGLLDRAREFVAEHMEQRVVHELLDGSVRGELDTPGAFLDLPQHG